MAAILNGFLPARRKDQFAQERILNTRWGDAAISAPMHGGWNTQPVTAQPQGSPELDRELPPTPPQSQDEQDGVFIVNDDESIADSQDYDDEASGTDRDNFTITIPLPWKKKAKGSSHSRKPSGNSLLNARFAPPRRVDVTSPPPLATMEAAAIPLPESRIASPVGRSSTTSPVLSFRSRLASPSLGDILSPVAEGFAKSGSSARPMPVLSPLQYGQIIPLERPPSASSIRSGLPRRPSLSSRNSEGIGAGTMSSQASRDEQAPELYRPPSRGIGATAHMRASSRGPRASSRGPRAPSVDPIYAMERVVSPEPVIQHVLDLEPTRRRAPSVEPVRRRAPSVEPMRRRTPSVEPTYRRAPSVGPLRPRASSPEPASSLPLRQRAPSPEPPARELSSAIKSKKRAVSREPRGRRGQSVEPRPRVRFHSEAGHRFRRRDSSSSNDGSVDSSADESSDAEPMTIVDRFERDYGTSRRPRRRRSIASPVTSPTAAVFGAVSIIDTDQKSTFESISTRAGLASIAQPIPRRNPPRNRSKSRTRGLYADMHDDFRLLARDVQREVPPVAIANSPIVSPVNSLAAAPIPQNIVSPILQRTASPALSTHLPGTSVTNMRLPATIRLESERQGYASDSSLTGLPPVGNYDNLSSGKNTIAVMARERRDHLRREERERAREKVARKLERERERKMAMNALSDCESIVSDYQSGTEKTRRVYGSGMDSDNEYSMAQRNVPGGKKSLVPNAEEIWG